MPLGVTNAFILTVNSATYDLRRVTHVAVRDATRVDVTFDWAPTAPVTFLTTTFEPAYQAALVALGGAAV